MTLSYLEYSLTQDTDNRPKFWKLRTTETGSKTMYLELVFAWGGVQFGFLCIWACNLTTVESERNVRPKRCLLKVERCCLYCWFRPILESHLKYDVFQVWLYSCFYFLTYYVFFTESGFLLNTFGIEDSLVKHITGFKSQNHFKVNLHYIKTNVIEDSNFKRNDN